MSDRRRWLLELTFLSAERGGRQSPVVLSQPYSYRPHVVVEHDSAGALPHLDSGQAYLGVAFAGPIGQFPIEQAFVADVEQIYPDVAYDALIVNAPITVREGSRVVARGHVVADLGVHEPAKTAGN